jgi:hypothetical protein
MPRSPQIRKSPAAPSLSFPYQVVAAGVVLAGEARDAGAPGGFVALDGSGGGAAAPFFNT